MRVERRADKTVRPAHTKAMRRHARIPDDDDLSSVFVLADGPGDHGVDAATFYGLVADGTLPEDDYSDPLDCLP